MAIHIRVDDWLPNSERQFACGIGPELPEGDTWFHISEMWNSQKADCVGCAPHKPQFGTPISQLSGRPGEPGYDRFVEVGNSWGYP